MKFIYCSQHGGVHQLEKDGSCWCAVSEIDKTKLKAKNRTDAIKECQEQGFWLYGCCKKCGHISEWCRCE